MVTHRANAKFRKLQIAIEDETILVLRFHVADAYGAMAMHDTLAQSDSVELNFDAQRIAADGHAHPVDAFPVRWKDNLDFSWRVLWVTLWAAYAIWTF